MTELTAERARDLLSYNPDTGVITWIAPTIGRRKQGAVANCKHIAGYLQTGIDGGIYLNHRLAWLMFYGCWPSKHIDHINGIRDDNRIANLRDVSHKTNRENAIKSNKNNKLGLLGVFFHKKTQKFVSSITVSGKTTYIGLFLTKEDAHSAYITAKRKLHQGCTI